MAFRIYNNLKFKTDRKDLRNNATFAEVMLWNILKKKQGIKVLRYENRQVFEKPEVISNDILSSNQKD